MEFDWMGSLEGAWPLIKAVIGMVIVGAILIVAALTMKRGILKTVIGVVSPFILVGVFLYLLLQN